MNNQAKTPLLRFIPHPQPVSAMTDSQIELDAPDTGMEWEDESRWGLIKCPKVHVQLFRWLPVRLMVQCKEEQNIYELPQRFPQAMLRAADVLEVDYRDELSWIFYGYRHGSMDEAAALASDEIDQSIDDEELERWFERVTNQLEDKAPQVSPIAQVLSNIQEPITKESNPTALWSFKSSLKRSSSLMGQLWEQGELSNPRWTVATSAPRTGFLPDTPISIPKGTDGVGPKNSPYRFRLIAGDGASALGSSNSLRPMIEAMLDTNPTARTRAKKYFSELCYSRTDRFTPPRKKSSKKK